MDENTPIQPVADAAAPTDTGEAASTVATDATTAPSAAIPAVDAAPAVAAALEADTAPPTADPASADDGNDQATTSDEPHPILAAFRQELDKIANMPAHIWHEIEAAFERVAAKL